MTEFKNGGKLDLLCKKEAEVEELVLCWLGKNSCTGCMGLGKDRCALDKQTKNENGKMKITSLGFNL